MKGIGLQSVCEKQVCCGKRESGQDSPSRKAFRHVYLFRSSRRWRGQTEDHITPGPVYAMRGIFSLVRGKRDN
jgi:hypothetical protein